LNKDADASRQHTVRVWASVGHRKDSRASVLQLEVLIGELSSVDALSTSTVVVGEVSTLAHETRNDTVERRSLESESRFSSAELTEVLGGLGDNVGTKSKK
jgi:hypothetical protein